jgi:hypothetical protein
MPDIDYLALTAPLAAGAGLTTYLERFGPVSPVSVFTGETLTTRAR